MSTRPSMPLPATLPVLAIVATFALAAAFARPHAPRTISTEHPAPFTAAACDLERTLTFIHARTAPRAPTVAAAAAARAVARVTGARTTLVALAHRAARTPAQRLAINLQLTHAALAYAAHDLIASIRFARTIEPDHTPSALQQVRAAILGDPAGDVLPDGVLDASDLCAILTRLEADPRPVPALAMR